MANQDMMRYLSEEGMQSSKYRQEKPKYTTIKINKDYKLLFNEIAYQRRAVKNDLIEQILIEWCQVNEPELLKKFEAKELPSQEK